MKEPNRRQRRAMAHVGRPKFDAVAELNQARFQVAVLQQGLGQALTLGQEIVNERVAERAITLTSVCEPCKEKLSGLYVDHDKAKVAARKAAEALAASVDQTAETAHVSKPSGLVSADGAPLATSTVSTAAPELIVPAHVNKKR